MKVEEITWNFEAAVLVYGDSTKQEAFKAAHPYLGAGCYHIGPVIRYRKWPDGSGEFDIRLDENKSNSIIGTFKARLVT